MAQKLLDVSSLAGYFIEIKEGKVVPLDPIAFEQVYAVEKLNHLKSQQAQLRMQIPQESLNKQKQLKSKIQAARRLQSVWFPRQRKLRLAGLRLRDQTSGEFYVAGGPEEIQGGLKEYWCPVYSPKKVDADAAAKILGVYKRRRGNDFSFDQISLPEAQDYSNFIGRAGNSTPGRDGLPYIAYNGCREFAGEVFAEAGDFLAVQEVPQGPSDLHDFLTDFNGQNVAFAPKGQEACDKVEPVRAPPNLRTIFLTNTDNKTVAGGD